jgi:hypothetical protein
MSRARRWRRVAVMFEPPVARMGEGDGVATRARHYTFEGKSTALSQKSLMALTMV